MKKIDKVKVGLGSRSYNILIGSDLLDICGKLIKPITQMGDVLILTENKVPNIYLKKVQRSLSKQKIIHNRIILPSGEKIKSFQYLEKVLDRMLKLKITRQSTVVALGGGAIGDLAGFASSIILRGINYIQIPTTLLSQVDSSVGGKTGINSRYGKNLVGSFFQPQLVIADISTLKTLPKRQMISGYSEIVKYGIMADRRFFSWLENNGSEVINHNKAKLLRAIKVSCQNKSKIVSADEKEAGIRSLLNLGHTFGHALENYSGYKLLHGEAVSIGMRMAVDLSVNRKFCNLEEANRVKNHLIKIGLPIQPKPKKAAKNALLDIMFRDKKVRNNKINFVLIKKIGDAFLNDKISRKDLEKFITTYL